MGWFYYSRRKRVNMALSTEKRSLNMALEPMLSAERDRALLKHIVKSREWEGFDEGRSRLGSRNFLWETRLQDPDGRFLGQQVPPLCIRPIRIQHARKSGTRLGPSKLQPPLAALNCSLKLDSIFCCFAAVTTF